MLSGCRTRGWTPYGVLRLQRVANYAVRRSFGMDCLLMEELGVSDAAMYRAAPVAVGGGSDFAAHLAVGGARRPHACLAPAKAILVRLTGRAWRAGREEYARLAQHVGAVQNQEVWGT